MDGVLCTEFTVDFRVNSVSAYDIFQPTVDFSLVNNCRVVFNFHCFVMEFIPLILNYKVSKMKLTFSLCYTLLCG